MGLPVPGATGSPADPAAPGTAVGLVERLRAVHLEMVDAVLSGEGLDKVAALAADAAGAPVAIVIPRLGAAAMAPQRDDEVLDALRRYVADRVKDRPTQVPDGLAAEVPIASGDDVVGTVALLGDPALAGDAGDFLHLAAVASLTEVAVEEAKEEVEQNLRGSFLEDLRSRPDLEPREIVRRADRLGCDLSRGAVVLCAELTTDRPRHVVATISGDEPGALAQHIPDAGPGGRASGHGRVYALIPAVGGDNAPEATLERARRLARRLGQH